jgi:regulator of RNase E activity RraA
MSDQRDLSSYVQALSKFTACDIADALVKLKVPNAGFLPDLQLRSPRSDQGESKITIAPASTILFAWKSGVDASLLPPSNIPNDEHWVDLTQKDTIVVMSQPQRQRCAVLGGIMALRIKVLHGKGIVVHGRVRDISELQETGLPVS